MRALRVLVLVVVMGVAVLLSSSAAGAVPPPAAVVAAPAAAPVIVPAAVPVAAVAPASAPCAATVRACIDLSTRQTWLLSAGKVVYGPVPITSGRVGYRTPPGTFRVQFKDVDHKSSLFGDAPMPYSVFFNGGIAFHQGSLSVPSHGCIHLSSAAARTYFSTLKVGDVVQVTR